MDNAHELIRGLLEVKDPVYVVLDVYLHVLKRKHLLYRNMDITFHFNGETIEILRIK